MNNRHVDTLVRTEFLDDTDFLITEESELLIVPTVHFKKTCIFHLLDLMQPITLKPPQMLII